MKLLFVLHQKIQVKIYKKEERRENGKNGTKLKKIIKQKEGKIKI